MQDADTQPYRYCLASPWNCVRQFLEQMPLLKGGYVGRKIDRQTDRKINIDTDIDTDIAY